MTLILYEKPKIKILGLKQHSKFLSRHEKYEFHHTVYVNAPPFPSVIFNLNPPPIHLYMFVSLNTGHGNSYCVAV